MEAPTVHTHPRLNVYVMVLFCMPGVIMLAQFVFVVLRVHIQANTFITWRFCPYSFKQRECGRNQIIHDVYEMNVAPEVRKLTIQP